MSDHKPPSPIPGMENIARPVTPNVGLLVQRIDWLLDTMRKISTGVDDPKQVAWDAIKRDHKMSS